MSIDMSASLSADEYNAMIKDDLRKLNAAWEIANVNVFPRLHDEDITVQRFVDAHPDIPESTCRQHLDRLVRSGKLIKVKCRCTTGPFVNAYRVPNDDKIQDNTSKKE